MKHRSPDHTVRLLTLLLWIPAFSFLLPYGVISHNICPTLAIAPMTFSAVTAIIHLAGKAKSRTTNIVTDLFIALFLLGTLIPGWVMMAAGNGRHYWRSNATGTTMVGTYGTAFAMASFVIHTYYCLRELYRACRRAPKKKCPHCHSTLGRTAQRSVYATLPADDMADAPEMAEEDDSNGSKETFHSSRGHVTLLDEEGRPSSSKEPRPSTDDETASALQGVVDLACRRLSVGHATASSRVEEWLDGDLTA
ncbi:hypothetical protein B0A55_00472 [Friedmanniomyces simplex]|uniref:Uncharacterized protein n=1 Tax=Friedmanniomyces simplex TaxID=329884 RepID=A0A4U0Y484_9PEZI|nr:hypothetical protein B0A55_00472 [Friedmanniomyces simplex]